MLRVFVSYSQESADHAAQVLKLAQRLRSDGIDCRLDAFINGNPDEGWQLWMEREIESSDYVLLICTETYLRRFMLEETPATGLGVPWEGQIIRSLLYASQGKPDKVVPIIFRKDDRAFIPRILRYQATYYILMDQYEKLLRFLSGQGGVLPVPVGHPVPLPPEEYVADDGHADDDRSFSPSIKRHMAALARRLKKLTEEQLRVIRQLQYLRRVRVSGIAGSGKTLVAAEKAIRLANERNKTLFLCHNPMLADYVSELTLGSGVAVEAFTEWVTALAGAKTISESSWSKIRRADERTSGLRI